MPIHLCQGDLLFVDFELINSHVIQYYLPKIATEINIANPNVYIIAITKSFIKYIGKAVNNENIANIKANFLFAPTASLLNSHK